MHSLAKFFPITKSEKETILAQYGKNTDSIKEDIRILREWLKKQKHIPEIEDDLFLVIMLLRNKCRMEKTKEKIDNYYTSKNINDVFKFMDPGTDKMIEMAKYSHMCYLPKLSPKTERIVYWTMNLPSDEHFDHTSILRHMILSLETQLQYDFADTIVFVSDFKQFTMKLVMKYDLVTLAKLAKVYFDTLSGRMSAIHILNATAAAEILLSFFKPFFSAKLRERERKKSLKAVIYYIIIFQLFFHPKVEALFEHIPRDYLPTEIGGTACSAIELSLEIVGAHLSERYFILKRNKLGTNEQLRIGKPYIEVNLYGIEGSFKKINID